MHVCPSFPLAVCSRKGTAMTPLARGRLHWSCTSASPFSPPAAAAAGVNSSDRRAV